jgi:hypothetical protein
MHDIKVLFVLWQSFSTLALLSKREAESQKGMFIFQGPEAAAL